MRPRELVKDVTCGSCVIGSNCVAGGSCVTGGRDTLAKVMEYKGHITYDTIQMMPPAAHHASAQ